jgi:hypothetical protein
MLTLATIPRHDAVQTANVPLSVNCLLLNIYLSFYNNPIRDVDFVVTKCTTRRSIDLSSLSLVPEAQLSTEIVHAVLKRDRTNAVTSKEGKLSLK